MEAIWKPGGPIPLEVGSGDTEFSEPMRVAGRVEPSACGAVRVASAPSAATRERLGSAGRRRRSRDAEGPLDHAITAAVVGGWLPGVAKHQVEIR
jgi:hypothetical protein